MGRYCIKIILSLTLFLYSFFILGQKNDTMIPNLDSNENTNIRYYKQCSKEELKNDISFLKKCLESSIFCF